MEAPVPLQAVSPYGRTKLIIEDMFRDLFAAEKDWRIILLRYFNPVGAHPSGEHLTVVWALSWAQRLRPAAISTRQQARQRLMRCVPAGEIGEHPVGIPNNLMPYVQQVRRLAACRVPARSTPAAQPHLLSVSSSPQCAATGGAGAAGGAQRVWRRLRHTRRHLRPRLHVQSCPSPDQHSRPSTHRPCTSSSAGQRLQMNARVM